MVDNTECNICIALLCGLPASGKSTLCRRLSEEGTKSGFKFYHVCYDYLLPPGTVANLVHTAVTEEGCTQWKKYRRNIVKCLENKISSILGSENHNQDDEFPPDIKEIFKQIPGIESDCLTEEKHVFLIDDNLYYRSMRYEYYQLARKYEVGFCEVYISCDVETALQRNRTREQAVPDDVIITMATKIEPPNQEEAWEQNSMHIDAFSDSVNKVLDLVNYALCHPEQRLPEEDLGMREESRVACSASLLHQADQIVRKLIGQYIAGRKESQSTEAGYVKKTDKMLNELKSEILRELKTGLLLIPSSCSLQVADASKNKDSAFYVYIQTIFQERTIHLLGGST